MASVRDFFRQGRGQIRYMRLQLSSAEMIAELVAMAKEVSADARRGERFDPPLNHAELAFYDAVAHQGIARTLMGDDTLVKIARALAGLPKITGT